METRLGKIENVRVGLGGYQESQYGIGFTLSGKGFGVCDFWGFWADPPHEFAKWTEEDQGRAFAETDRRIVALLKSAEVLHVEELKGKPVEMTFDDLMLKSWRILEEVL